MSLCDWINEIYLGIGIGKVLITQQKNMGQGLINSDFYLSNQQTNENSLQSKHPIAKISQPKSIPIGINFNLNSHTSDN